MDKQQRFLIISDVHGFYDEMIDALNKVNFNPETDFLISLGDTTDRGPNPQEVINFLESLPRKKLVLGNHESLLVNCIKNGFPSNIDWHNGTAQTILDLAPNSKTFEDACVVAYEKVKPFVDSMVNYWETANYIFVHSFIPLKCLDNLPKYYTKNRQLEFNPDWRYAHASEWEEARWGNPLELATKGLNQTNKCIICGHWHCSAGWAKEAGIPEFGYGACFEPYYYNDKLIMIDACTAYSKKVNVLVLEDKFLEEGDNAHDDSAAS